MDLEPIIACLCSIEEDGSVPKNVRTKIKWAISFLQEDNSKSEDVKIDQILQQLDELSDDPNLTSYTRTQIWNVVSTLESRQG